VDHCTSGVTAGDTFGEPDRQRSVDVASFLGPDDEGEDGVGLDGFGQEMVCGCRS